MTTTIGSTHGRRAARSRRRALPALILAALVALPCPAFSAQNQSGAPKLPVPPKSLRDAAEKKPKADSKPDSKPEAKPAPKSEHDAFVAEMTRQMEDAMTRARGAKPLDRLGALPVVSGDDAASKTPEFRKAYFEAYAATRLKIYNEILESQGFKPNGRIQTSERFVLIYNTSDSYLNWVRALMEEVADAFEKAVVKLGGERVELERPASVFLFAREEEFLALDRLVHQHAGDESYENRTGAPSGFYSTYYDCAFIYDQTATEAARVEIYGADEQKIQSRKGAKTRLKQEADSVKYRDASGANTRTIVHEETHQLAYNYGLVRRRGTSPLWMVEGMAMLTEPTDPNAPLGWKYRGKFPANKSRYDSFASYARTDANLSMVDALIEGDAPIAELRSEAYATAWAMFYYCYSRKQRNLAKYVAGCRDCESENPSAEERRKLFVESFGDVAEFKKGFAKFMANL